MNVNNKKLTQDFYLQPTKKVARNLIGKVLVHRLNQENILAGRIVETEAYLGVKDPACHTFNHRHTSRNASMYLNGGHAYVYFIYGMYFCFNVVTRTEKNPEAVLIRAIEPLLGLDLMKQWRPVKKIEQISNGPGKLCLAMKIDRDLDGTSLLDDQLYIEDWNESITPRQIIAAPRIGVTYAGAASHWPLRFYLKCNNYVSQL